MAKRVFVGNLALAVTDQELRDLFAAYGSVRKAEVVRGRGGRSRGFAYVELATDAEAARAIAELNGREVQGRPVTLAEARSTAPRTPMQEADQHFELTRGRPASGGKPWNRR